MTDFVTSADGTRISYDLRGSGPAVVLVAGAAQFRAVDASGTGLATALAARGFTVLSYDRRGRGSSTDTEPYDVDREVEDLAALLEVVGEAALFGSSSGAVLALWAAQAGLPITRLVLWEPPLTLEDDGSAFLAGLQERLAARDRISAIAFFMGDMPEEWFDRLTASTSWPAMMSIAPTLAYDAAVLERALRGAPWSQQWDAVTVPALVLVGHHTLPVFPPAANALVAAVPSAQQLRMNADHGRWLPEQMASVVTRYLNDPLTEPLDVAVDVPPTDASDRAFR